MGPGSYLVVLDDSLNELSHQIFNNDGREIHSFPYIKCLIHIEKKKHFRALILTNIKTLISTLISYNTTSS